MKSKKILIGAIVALLFPAQVFNALAEGAYQRNVVITGYYSPLPDQPYYVTGSYAGDVRLNGRGTNGADGTPVYPGMIAAPKDYPFGTRIDIPGIGLGTVHDRGGAIISNYKDKVTCGADEECERVDRLDIWLGHGMEGLARALYYIGVKRATATVYPAGTLSMADYMPFPPMDVASLFKNKIKGNYVASAGTSDSSNVKKYQEMLTLLGFYEGPIDGQSSLDDSVYRFQVKHGIVKNKSDKGAGHIGPQTGAKLVEEMRSLQNSIQAGVPQTNMGKGSHGAQVEDLQRALAKLGFYHGDITGSYDDATIDAVFQMQLAQEVVNTASDTASGYYGPKTRSALEASLRAHEKFQRQASLNAELPPSKEEAHDEAIIQEFIDTHLGKNDSGEAVTKLQEYLNKLGYLDHEPTGYFGKLTEAAVLKFQKDNDLVASPIDTGAGQFGPATQAKLASVVQKVSPQKIERKVKATKIIGIAKRPTAEVHTAQSGAKSI